MYCWNVWGLWIFRVEKCCAVTVKKGIENNAIQSTIVQEHKIRTLLTVITELYLFDRFRFLHHFNFYIFFTAS